MSLSSVFDHPSLTGAAIIAAKTAAVYVVLVVGLRLFGKRELGQMSLYDLVLIIILGNAVQNAMINNDNTLGGGIVAAIVLLVMNRVVNAAIARSKRVERALVGEPVLFVREGVHMCVLEVDGSISVVPRGSTVLKTRHHYRGLRLP
jgi:uncharacterized membrane protein YcaP (DUF421 family)